MRRSTSIAIKPVKLRSASEEYPWGNCPEVCFESIIILETSSESSRLALFFTITLWAPVTWLEPIYLQCGRPASSNLTLHYYSLGIHTFINKKCMKEQVPHQLHLFAAWWTPQTPKAKAPRKKNRHRKEALCIGSKINIIKVQETTDQKFFFSSSSFYSSRSSIWP